MSACIIFLFSSLLVVKSGDATKPVVTFSPNWGNILQKDSITMTCNVTSTKPEELLTYSWYKDNQPIRGDQRSLYIYSSAEKDSGDYQCQTSEGDISDPVTLSVTASKYVILQRPPSTIYEGEPLALRCHHVIDYIGLGEKFYKDDVEIKPQSPSSEFHIGAVDLSTAGRYRCTKGITFYSVPSSQIFSDEFSLSVKELFSPPEIKSPDRVREGDDMTVRCDTTLDPLRGDTELHFAFYRDGETVRGFNVSNTYSVRSCHPGDSGKYTCEVMTLSGTVRKMSDGFYIRIYDYTMVNIIRLVLSVCVSAAAVCFIYFHNKW